MTTVPVGESTQQKKFEVYQNVWIPYELTVLFQSFRLGPLI